METLEVFNEQNESIGTALRSDVHRKGLYHRAVHMAVFNRKGELFLQRRALSKLICPGKWDISAAEHLKPGESFEQAAVRGLKEELGIENATVEQVRKASLSKKEYSNGSVKDYEFTALFTMIFDGCVKIDTTEVMDGRFFSVGEILVMIENSQKSMTPWLLKELAVLKLI